MEQAIAIGIIVLVLLYGTAVAQDALDNTDSLPAGEIIVQIPEPNMLVRNLANGIAHAEGYGADLNNFPTRNNNPGDMTKDLVGGAIGKDQNKIVFATAEDGWNNLFAELELIVTGRSRVYNLDMSWQDFADKWTGGDSATSWLQVVLQYTGADPNRSIGTYFQVS